MVKIVVEGKPGAGTGPSEVEVPLETCSPTPARLPRRHSRRLASTRGLRPSKEAEEEKARCGWVRVLTDEVSSCKGTLVYLTPHATVRDICHDLVLEEEVTVWVQYGGGASQRLGPRDTPLTVQDEFLHKLGYTEHSRRARLGIDPELKHLIRFHLGPSVPLPELGGYARSGAVYVLKGLVFPQWRRRPVAVIGPKLFLYPGSAGQSPEVVDLSRGAVTECGPRNGRLVLRVEPRETEGKYIFLGFNQPWERDLWIYWLIKATHTSCATRLDLTDSGLERLPDSLSAFPGLEELLLGRNKLGARSHATPSGGGSNLEILARLPRLRKLLLSSNQLPLFPSALLQLNAVVHLDLSDNNIADLPQDLVELTSLEELRLDRNVISDLPEALGRLGRLRILTIGYNCLQELPSFLLVMRALALLDFQGNRVDNEKLPPAPSKDEASLARINLRANLLKGNIVLGNYGNLTQLDVSENSIETLDLTALGKLESVQCSKNKLVELSLNGKSLVSLIAGNNKLKKLTVHPSPVHLKHLDVSYNELETLPEWTAGCTRLGALFATHNKLRTLPAHLFCSELSCLQTLQLSYNQLGSLPAVLRHIPLQELFLQSNNLTTLPHNFLTASTRMRVLNLSNNRLCELPAECEGLRGHLLEKIYLTGNCLSDNAMDVLGRLTNLHTLHAAYNCITTLPESCIAVWKDLEELLLSGNKLQHLPDNIIHLRHLRVLRVHSNRLQSSPCFAKMASLKVLDLAHNRLDRINLATLVPQQLQFLDLSCNSRLYVDPRQFQVYRAHRPMSLVDVSGQNRTCLPSTPYHEEGGELEPPWKVGFSETAGLREKLYITQIRLPAFCNTEGLFGMFDGGNNNEVPDVLMRAVPRILLEERTVKETANEYMKYTMLSAHRELKEKGQKYGVCGTLCHICRAKPTSAQNNYLPGSQRYVLRVASVGEARAVICRRNGPVTLSRVTSSTASQNNLNRSQIGCSSRFPLVIPDPQITEVTLEDHDEFLIVANKRFWEVVDVDEAVEEVREVGNAILAAKKLQDIAQSYGSEENLSVMVVRFRDLGSEVEQLMRELRHTIRRNRHQQDSTPTAESSMTCGGCCCREHRVVSPGKNGFYDNRVMIPNGHGHLSNGGSLLNCNLTNGNFTNSTLTNGHLQNCGSKHHVIACHCASVPETERSSPSGQSDPASSDCFTTRDVAYKTKDINGRYLQQREFFSKNKAAVMVGGQSVLMHENGIKKMSSVVPTLERRSYRDSKRSGSGVVRAIRAKCSTSEEEETCSDKSGTQLSEEQFKCWEYMLEQNTQLLFDKELDTLSRGFTRRPMSASLQHRGKALSRSNPHLSEPSPVPFLSRHFGSARSFNPVVRNTPRFSSGRHFLNGGPNAAYFGSLQRLMPYNLEYDFSVIQEKANQDSMEQDGRMKQYWDIATTEL